MPEPLGKTVGVSTFVNSNNVGNVVIRRSHTGVFIFFNSAPIIQFSNVIDVIGDKNVVTKILNNSTGFQRIELNGFAKRHWQTGYYPFSYGWCLGLC